MLNLTEVQSFWRTVRVTVPDSKNPDKVKEAKFLAKFRMMNRDEMIELTNETETEKDFLDEILLDVKEVECPPDMDAVEGVKANPITAKAVVETYTSVITGAERKNLRK